MKTISAIVLTAIMGIMLVGCSCNTCQPACEKPVVQKCYKGENQ